MTKQDWDTLQKAYESTLFATAKLQVGDYKVFLKREFTNSKVYNVVYVNNEWRGSWLSSSGENVAPESVFMYRKHQTYRSHTDQELKKLKREFGAAFAKKFEPKEFTITVPFYPGFSAFKRQMIATGLPISIISES